MHELELSCSKRRLCAYILHALSVKLGGFDFRGNAEHALNRVQEQDCDRSSLQT